MADDFKSLVILAVGVMTAFSSNPISSAHMLPTVSLLGLSVFAHASLRRSAIEDFDTSAEKAPQNASRGAFSISYRFNTIARLIHEWSTEATPSQSSSSQD